jgi:hypothetical protein
MVALYSHGCIIVIVVTALHNLKENKMVSKEQVDRIVEAIEGVSTEIADNSTHSLAVDDYNLVSSIWEALDSIANTLKKIEAKMK